MNSRKKEDKQKSTKYYFSIFTPEFGGANALFDPAIDVVNTEFWADAEFGKNTDVSPFVGRGGREKFLIKSGFAAKIPGGRFGSPKGEQAPKRGPGKGPLEAAEGRVDNPAGIPIEALA